MGWSSRAVVAGTAAVVVGLPAVVGPVTAAGAAPPQATTTTAAPALTSVTLITGDRLLVGGQRMSIDPRTARPGVSFGVTEVNGHRFVIPSDAEPLIAAGRVDRRLFDITALTDAGYDDARTSDVPLIVEQNRRPGTRTAATIETSGVRITRTDLGRPGMVAVRAAKSAAGAFWSRLSATSTDIARVWLDGRRTPVVDRSVTQIGAPQAWQAGFTGEGVKVAVLDSGVDATHPDLAGQVAAAKTFTFDPNPDDVVGHGTHVASTIAGSGANLGGRYRGVAPGAELLSAKVCEPQYCMDSAILAGMQWAVDQGAKIVNMSLGSPDLAGVDPIEASVNRLSKEHGTLFVVAAGNTGDDASVASPASADAALAVGAVDRDGTLAPFSSRGPRSADGAVKPDITAPGVGIVAAASSTGGAAGPAPDPGYVARSGTSMAAPHVAGAAALLAQRHPNWTGQQLKAALMAAARPNPELHVFQQGAGRIDVATAIAQQVWSEPVSLSMGTQQWPHGDDPAVNRSLTYTNAGSAAVTFDVAVEATGPDGKPAPAGLFRVDPAIVTVPAGGTATVTVVADTTVGSVDGAFSGAVVATAAGGAGVRTPIAVTREPESYDLTIRYVDVNGAPTTSAYGELFGLDALVHRAVNPAAGGVATVRLPKGSYTMYSRFGTRERQSFVLTPSIVVDRSIELTIDDRVTKPVKVTVADDPAAKAHSGTIYTNVSGPAGMYGFGYQWIFMGDFDAGGRPLFIGRTGPEVPPGRVRVNINSSWAGTSTEPATRRFYFGNWDLDRYPDGFTRTLAERSMARVDAIPPPGIAPVYHWFPGSTVRRIASYFSPAFDISGATKLTSFVTTRAEKARFAFAWGSDERVETPMYTFRRGQRVHLRPGRPLFGPTLSFADAHASAPRRIGDRLAFPPPHVLLGDGEGNRMWTRLDSGQLTVARLDKPGPIERDREGLYPVPADQGVYRVDVAADRADRYELSTRAAVSYTFTSGHVPENGPTPLPLSMVRFVPALDASGAAPGGRTFVVPLVVQTNPGSTARRLRLGRIKVDVSYDDGATWRRAPVAGHAAILRHPPAGGYVSLRGSAADSDGNTVTVTIVRAYKLA